jgi:hypothetical protein
LEVVCEYLDVEEDALSGVYRIAEEKLAAAARQRSTAGDRDA